MCANEAVFAGRRGYATSGRPEALVGQRPHPYQTYLSTLNLVCLFGGTLPQARASIGGKFSEEKRRRESSLLLKKNRGEEWRKEEEEGEKK